MAHCAYMVGFGSQGRAWAECLRLSGWQVRVFLSREGLSFQKARESGFAPSLLDQLPQALSADAAPGKPLFLPFLCPDTDVAPVYEKYLSGLTCELTLVLAHGYAVYADELRPANPAHEIALLAPKAIGPKLEAAFRTAHASNPNAPRHSLVAGFHASAARLDTVQALARGLGFSTENLAPATFEEEAIGDLISEQGLLCGGVFTLLEWTMEAMAKAGVPDALIREECLTELELIAGLLRERGPASTLRKISQAAQSGTIAMNERFLRSGVRAEFDEQVQDVLSRRFAHYFREGNWKPKAEDMARRLEVWEKRFQKKRSS